VLEAGAMVLCHKGVIAIDEFDKMGKDDQIAMHEALEQQTISIAKASIIATLPAQVSVLAGANPKFSRFDVYRPLMEQTDIPDTLLSRFDLKFALRDVPDKENDERIASHILESRLNPEIRKPEISQEFLRKFIAYMRQNCHPRMTKEALERIKNFYVTMRGMYKGEDTVAITLRQNEAMLRLAEASAKVRLSQVAEIQDAERAIKIMKVSLQQFGYDYETGKIDVDRTEGTSSSQRSKIRILLDVIEALEKRIGKQIPKEDIIAEAEDHGLKGVDDMIQKMKSEGMLFEPKHNMIQKL
ncbi:AAA family ATPase, partial [archaeon]